MGADVVLAAALLPAIAEELYTVGVLIHHGKMIVYMAVLRGGAHLTTAQADGADRVFVLHHPGANIQEVDVLLDVEIAAEPGEVVPVAHLPDHVGPAGLARLDPDRPAIVI